MNSAPPDRAALAGMIDHTLLDPAATAVDLDRLCAEALELGFANVCVNPVWAERCVARLRSGGAKRGRGVGVCAVVGFPLGASLTEVKALEARRMAAAGVREVDVMIHLGALKGGDHPAVRADLGAVVAACAPVGVKAILETARLTAEEKAAGARLAVEAGAAFVKTSTGFAGGGATVEDVRLLRALVGPDIGVKASGGIRTLDQALALRDAGASRLGTSAGVAILRELDGRA